jgi:hypothetical protein
MVTKSQNGKKNNGGLTSKQEFKAVRWRNQIIELVLAENNQIIYYIYIFDQYMEFPRSTKNSKNYHNQRKKK